MQERQDDSMATWTPVGEGSALPKRGLALASTLERSPLSLGMSCLRSLPGDLESHEYNAVICGRSLGPVVPA